MAKTRIFFPQDALDTWMLEGHVELAGEQLTMKSEGRKYRITEAARILREVTGTTDGFDLIGRVKSKAFLAELGAELLETSMVLGENAYDVVPGFLGMPIGTLAEHLSIQPPSGKAPASDEELLGQFLLRVL